MTQKRSISSVALSIGLLGLLVVGSATQATADTIIDTNSSTFSITANTIVPSEGVQTLPTSAVDVTTLGGGWAAAISGTSWISPIADQGDKSANDIGYVAYTTTFSSIASAGTLVIDYAADDWTTIILNGKVIYGPPGTCTVGVANSCGTTNPGSWTTDTTLTFTGLNLIDGTNTLTFDVSNTGGGSDAGGGPTGLDAQISLTAVPEPSSLLLLGSGMLTVGGFIRRKFMRS